jgi:predicted dehydrogenase
MKILIIGLGSIGKRHLKTLTNLKKKIGYSSINVFDTNPNRYKEISTYKVDIFPSLKESLKNVSVVFICVSTSAHIKVYNEISSFGKFHIFLEKPMSHTLDGCSEMLSLQKKIKKKLVLGYMMRFHPVLQEVKKYLKKGTIGKVLSVRAEAGFYLPFWHPWENYRDFYMSSKAGGGGVLLDTSHELDYLCWLFGQVETVQGTFGKISNLDITSDDFASAILKFKNGIVGEVHLDLLQPEESRYVKIIGSKGVLIGDLNNKTVKFNSTKNQNWITKKILVNFDKIYNEELINFFKYISKGKKSEINENDAYHVMELIEAVRRSSAYGVKINLPIYN